MREMDEEDKKRIQIVPTPNDPTSGLIQSTGIPTFHIGYLLTMIYLKLTDIQEPIKCYESETLVEITGFRNVFFY